MKISLDDETIFLTGEIYQKYLFNEFTNASNPLKGMGIGETEHWLIKKVGKITESLSLYEFLNEQL